MAERPERDAWQVHGSRPIYQSQWVDLSLTDVELPNGDRFEHHTLRMPTAVVAVVLDPPAERVLLSWRHRFVPDVWNYEVPGGLVEDGEDPGDTIRREILEETGHSVESVEHVTTFEPMIGMVTSPHHVYVARGARQVREPAEKNEGCFKWIPVTQLEALIADGEIANSGSLVALLWLLLSRTTPS